MTRHWAIAAKFGDGTGDPPYHPLFCHMADVAAVAMAMWGQVLAPALRQRLSAAFDLDEREAGRWTAFVAGIHDLGKASPAFASKDPSFAARANAWGLPNASVSSLSRPPGHGLVSQVALREILRAPPFGLPGRAADLLASIAGGHHGTFPTDAEVTNVDYRSAIGGARWASLRSELAIALHGVLDLTPAGEDLHLTGIDGAILAGLTSVADWIGSDERFFPYAEPADEREYFVHATERARKALGQLGWLTARAPSTRLAFEDLFPAIAGPLWPAQRATVDISESGSPPRLLIIEAPMGEGKTEAAMFAADAADVHLGTQGAYFALPTMATSNQMFGRVAEFLRTRFPDDMVQLQLRHGHASFVSEFERIRQYGNSIPEPRYSTDADGGSLVAADWFAPAKRGLLAPFGVGTVDQLLMAVLQVKHVFARLFGFAGKVVEIDKVHAYDTNVQEGRHAWRTSIS